MFPGASFGLGQFIDLFSQPSFGHPGVAPSNAGSVTRELVYAGLAERVFPNRPELRPMVCRCADDCGHASDRPMWVQVFNGQVRIAVSNGENDGPEVIDFTPGQPFNGGDPLTLEQENLILRLAEEARVA